MLSSTTAPRPGMPIESGALRGGRHIGVLCDILERYRVTPDRYTPQTLSDALQQLISTGRLPLPELDRRRDPVAVFAWMLKTLASIAPSQTLLEQLRDEQRAKAARILERQREQTRAAQVLADPAAQEAAAAFFAQHRRLRGRHTPLTLQQAERRLVTALIGAATKLYAAPTALQLFVGEVTALHRHLIRDGWELTTEPGAASWAHSPTGQVIRISASPAPHIVSPALSSLAPAVSTCVLAVMHACKQS
ncbi:hypothetical protein [Microbacterium testaceum]|uniref:hypothetical protein n=1 Tax=Microbacterium testaceum TaxID=2033 RepID=UPI002AC73262|nr:hypothetical protein [Microbacterium testaceum]MDZ5146366.1 hypothetical protein [Microbacterium testaceum]